MPSPSCFTTISRASLLTLALLAPGCLGGMSGTSEYEQTASVEKGFAEQIAAAGGTAKKEGRTLVQGKIEGTGWFVDLSGDTITDDVIEAIIEARKTDRVFDLNVSGSTITDEQLAKLDAGNVLEFAYWLNLSNTGLTDAGLDKCTHVFILMELNVKGSKITQAGVDRLFERKQKDPQTPPFFKKKPKVEI